MSAVNFDICVQPVLGYRVMVEGRGFLTGGYRPHTYGIGESKYAVGGIAIRSEYYRYSLWEENPVCEC